MLSFYSSITYIWNKTALQALCLGFISCSLWACNPTLRTHGYIPSKNKPQAIEAVNDNKASVLSKLGSPSLRGTFEPNTWYYMHEVREHLAYLHPHTNERSITSIHFNDEGQVTAVDEYRLENGQYVSLQTRKTPTRGRELSVFEQLFGTVGRLPIDQLAGNRQNIPGGGGPGTGN